MEKQNSKVNIEELLSPNIINHASRFLNILEYVDSIEPTREDALVLKKAMSIQHDSVLFFLLKKSFRLAAFKLKGAAFKISLAGLEKLLQCSDRLDDLALAISSITKTEAFMASDCFKTANWKEFPTEILPCFCYFYKNYGNSQDLDDLIELTRHPNPTVIAAAVEAIKKLDTGSLRSIIEPLIKGNTESKDSEALEQLYVRNVNYNSGNIANESKEYFLENHNLLINSLKNESSELEIVRVLRLIKKYGDEGDAEFVKPLLNKDKPDIVRASIKVLEKLSPDYLYVYLPQLMQHKNNKIRMTATRAFQTIDRDSVVSIVKSFLKSLNVKQRTIGITTSMMVDFFQVREDLLNAFMRETNEELLEKIGLVFAANPYEELVYDLYAANKSSKTILKNQREKIIEMVSEKVSIALGGTPWAKELIMDAQKKYEENIKSSEENNNNGDTNKNQATPRYTNNSSVRKLSIDTDNLSKSIQKKSELEKNKPNTGWSDLSIKAKLIVIFFLLGSVFSALVFVLLVMQLF